MIAGKDQGASVLLVLTPKGVPVIRERQSPQYQRGRKAFWKLPAGKIGISKKQSIVETPLQCAVREHGEESGIWVSSDSVVLMKVETVHPGILRYFFFSHTAEYRGELGESGEKERWEYSWALPKDILHGSDFLPNHQELVHSVDTVYNTLLEEIYRDVAVAH